MNINATFYTFSKRENSTKKPTEEGTTIQVSFKDETDLFTPILEVVYTSAFNFNYCYIDFTGRYYKITAADTIARNTYRLHLQTDVLATYRDDVKGQTVYALYCSYTYDDMLDDTRVEPMQPALADVKKVEDTIAILPSSPSDPYTLTAFMSVINNNGLLNGIDIFYGAGNTLPSAFLEACADLSFLHDFFADLSGASPLDAVNEIWWTPLLPSVCHNVSTNEADLYGVELSGDVIADPSVKGYVKLLNLPQPSYTDFRYSDKYVKYYLQLPYVGCITIPTTLARMARAVRIGYAGDCLTGQIVYDVRVGDVDLGMFGTSLKSPLTLARQGSQAAHVATSGALGLAGGLALAGKAAAVGGGLAGFGVTAAFTAAGAFKGLGDIPEITRVSSAAGSVAPVGLAYNMNKIVVTMIESPSSVDPATLASVAGRPCNRITTVQNGYVMTNNASVSFAGTPDEIDAFNAYLNGGIYVE